MQDRDYIIVGETINGNKFEDHRFNERFAAFYHSDRMLKGLQLTPDGEKVLSCKVDIREK